MSLHSGFPRKRLIPGMLDGWFIARAAPAAWAVATGDAGPTLIELRSVWRGQHGMHAGIQRLPSLSTFLPIGSWINRPTRKTPPLSINTAQRCLIQVDRFHGVNPVR